MLSLRHEPMDDFFFYQQNYLHPDQDPSSASASSTMMADDTPSFISLPHLTKYSEEAQNRPVFEQDNIITEDMCIRGIDMQGIDWFKESMTRDEYRNQRIKEYETYLSCKSDDEDDTLEEQIQSQQTKPVAKNEEYYTFKSSKINEPCSIGHFQLRNLVWATNKNNLYYICGDTVRQWSPQRQRSAQVMDLSTANIPGSISFKITSMACAQQVLFAGGFQGECAWKSLDSDTPIQYLSNASTASGITNYTDIIRDKKGVLLGIVSNNDASIKCINLTTAQVQKTLTLPFAVNCSSISPDQNMLCLVGDSTETHLIDANNGEPIAKINEHFDFSFACCWHPDGRTFATGNQDRTTRVYDVRNTSSALHVLGSHVGAIRSLHYSNDGQYLAAAEPIDFVHIYETQTYNSSQVIDMFGDIAGVSFTPEDQSLFIANTDERVGGIFEFQKVEEDPIFYF
ncbi:hypothetical protein MBANPS3_001727 [Mucor bainieri]